tara:strand:+ start:125 stop:445 length:321 start_codon:yes stop_codon:yes gene_type:complete
MFLKDEKKALTRLSLLAIGWGVGLDRFYEGNTKGGFLSLVGWSLIFGSLIFLSPCQGYDYAQGGKASMEMIFNPYTLIPLGLGAYGVILVIKKAFRLLKQFENVDS